MRDYEQRSAAVNVAGREYYRGICGTFDNQALLFAAFQAGVKWADANPEPAPAERPLGEHDSMEWCNYVIRRKKDMADWQHTVGYVVTKGGCNVMPGAAWFKSLASAKRGIAAFALACKIAPRPPALPGIPECEGDTFWYLVELARVHG